MLIHAINAIDHLGMPGFPDQQSVSGPDRTYHPVTWVFHCGSRPQDKYGRDNPWDLSGLIPATKISDLIAEFITGLNSVTDDAVTISSGVFRYTLHVVIGTHQEIMQEMARQEVVLPANLPGATAMQPAWVAETFAIDTTYTDFSLTRNVPTGRIVKRVAILSQDATATRPLVAQDEITGAKLDVRLQTVMKVFADGAAAMQPKGNIAVADDAVELGGRLIGIGRPILATVEGYLPTSIIPYNESVGISGGNP